MQPPLRPPRYPQARLLRHKQAVLQKQRGMRMARCRALLKQYREVLLYVFFGGCTTLINLGSYWLLRALTNWNYNLENILSVTLAILFAYWANSRFVFCSTARTLPERLAECAKFIAARLSTMALEVGGVFAMVEFLRMRDTLAKLAIQFVVLALNYLFSKFLVFTKGNRS